MNVLTLKQMEEIYIGYGLTNETRVMFLQMASHGLIKESTLIAFVSLIKDYHFSDETQTEIVDGDGKVIYRATGYRKFERVVDVE